MQGTILSLIDLSNKSYLFQVPIASSTLLSHSLTLTESNAKSLQFLRLVNLKNQELTPDLYNTLAMNLSTGSRPLRLATLKALTQLKPLTFLSASENKININNQKKDQETIEEFYTGDCKLISLLNQCEQIEINLLVGKEKKTLLRNVGLMCASGFVPDAYMELAFRYCIGTLWVKFTPIHEAAMDVLNDFI